jgi:hypothetical protein
MSMHGYTRNDLQPVTLPGNEMAELLASALIGDDDRAALRRAGHLLDGQIEDLLDVWYGFVGSQPHLLAHFSTPAGEPIGDYLGAVRARFGQWVRDVCAADYDASWLAYQLEVGRRHATVGKNRTDGADSTAYVPVRHLVALIAPITLTVRPFLESRASASDDLDAMMAAWLKAVVLHVAVWTQPYVADGQW